MYASLVFVMLGVPRVSHACCMHASSGFVSESSLTPQKSTFFIIRRIDGMVSGDKTSNFVFLLLPTQFHTL